MEREKACYEREGIGRVHMVVNVRKKIREEKYVHEKFGRTYVWCAGPERRRGDDRYRAAMRRTDCTSRIQKQYARVPVLSRD